MITVYLGDVTPYLATLAKTAASNATLIDNSNFQNLKPGTYYTSLGDLGSLNNLGEVLQQASKIVYAPPTKWSDDNQDFSYMRVWSEDYAKVFFFKCVVIDPYNGSQSKLSNTDVHVFSNLLDLVDTRKTNQTQLWIAGCSISHGCGVTNETRYGQLLADKLKLKASFLTKRASSIAWAADQILRSDIREKDIVVWGLTSHTRFSKFERNKFEFITHSNCPDSATLDYITSDHNLYHSVASMYQVINFCKKANVVLVLASLLDNTLIHYLEDFTPLVMLSCVFGRNKNNMFLDIGLDGTHPGTVTHKYYADQIYQKIQTLVEET